MVQGKTVTVEAIEEHPYDGLIRKVGERYEAEEGHVDFLTIRHWARLAAGPTPGPAAEPPPAKPAPRKK